MPVARVVEHDGNGRRLLPPIVINIIALMVTIVWSVSFIVDIVVRGYDPPGSLHAAFMLILGAVFGSQMIRGVLK